MSETTGPSSHTLTFLGTGASAGVPSFYCGCAACEEVLRDPRAARDCSDLLVHGEQNILVDTAPELRTQLIREGVSHIDAVFYTHEHFDHTGGLPQLEFFVRLRSQRPLPVYASAQTLAALEQRFDFMLDVLELHLLEAFEPVELDGVRYTPLPAAHSEGAFGFLIETAKAAGARPEPGDPQAATRAAGATAEPGDPQAATQAAGATAGATAGAQAGGTRLAYFPDTGPLPPETERYLRKLDAAGGLDVLAIDATFNGRNWMPAAHHSISEAIALAETLGVRQAYLTHLSMHYDTPITLAELEEQLTPYQGRIAVAHDGLRIAL
ncbi:MAG: MBL fold metallo-hydrolase [Coriobacteriales bacterium]|nr:MBL fold metallo-hydrolase [Coriobacteriales bacterium]